MTKKMSCEIILYRGEENIPRDERGKGGGTYGVYFDIG
jgi:hypothetical protein